MSKILLELLSLRKKKFTDDLEHFVSISGNSLANNKKKAFLFLLKQKMLSEKKIARILDKNLGNKAHNQVKGRMTKAIRRYLSLLELERKEVVRDLLLLNTYIRENLRKNSNATYNKVLTHLSNPTQVSNKTSLYKYQLYEMAVAQKKTNRKEDENLLKMEKSLEEFYLENKLICLCEKRNRNGIINTDFSDTNILEEVEKRMETTSSIGLKIYYHLYKTIIDFDDAAFFEVWNIIKKNSNILESQYFRNICSHLLNYCVRRVNENKLEYATIYIEILGKLIEKKLIVENGIIDPGFFKNSISVYLINTKIDEAEIFLNTWTDCLESSIRKDIVQGNKALIEFEKGNWKECSEILKDYNPYDFYYKVLSDKLLLKISYHEFDLKDSFFKNNLVGRIHTAKKFIKNKGEINESKKNKILAFFDLLLDLSQGRTVNLDERIELLSPSDYAWLQKQIEEKR